MNLAGSIAFVDELIANQRATVRLQVALALGVVVLGIGIMAVVNLAPADALSDAKGLLTLGGAFVSTLTAFPLKDIASRRDKVAALRMIRVQLANQGSSSSAEVERLHQRLYQFVDQLIGA